MWPWLPPAEVWANGKVGRLRSDDEGVLVTDPQVSLWA